MVSFAGERGAVNILYLVITLVVALAFGALWFTQLQENEKLVEHEAKAKATLAQAENDIAWYKGYYTEISQRIGGGVPTALPGGADFEKLPSEVAKTALKGVDEALSNIGKQVNDTASSASPPTNLVEALLVPVTRYKSVEQDVRTRDTRVKELQAEVEQKDKDLRAAVAKRDEELQRIQTEYNANISRLSQQNSDLQNEVATTTAKVAEQNTEMETTRQTSNKEKQELTTSLREFEGQVRTLHSAAKLERETEVSDGKILSADPKLGLGMIDITSSDLVRRGTRFKVYESGKGNTKIHKGWVTVTDIGPRMSEVRIDEIVPGVGAIGAGDWLYNPYFSKTAGRKINFHFLGQLPGRYTRETAERILKGFGASVQDKVTIETDFLVLGENEDPDADPLTESADYRNAMTWGIEVIRARDLAPFLQM